MQPSVSQGLGSWEPKDPARWDLPLLCGADPAEILLPRPLQPCPKDPVAEKTDRRGADRHRHSRRQSPEDKLSDQLAATLDLQPFEGGHGNSRDAAEAPMTRWNVERPRQDLGRASLHLEKHKMQTAANMYQTHTMPSGLC